MLMHDKLLRTEGGDFSVVRFSGTVRHLNRDEDEDLAAKKVLKFSLDALSDFSKGASLVEDDAGLPRLVRLDDDVEPQDAVLHLPRVDDRFQSVGNVIREDVQKLGLDDALDDVARIGVG